jgi:RNA polymerase sigma factor (sigma-70 family)
VFTRTFTLSVTLRNLSLVFDTYNKSPFYLGQNGVRYYNNSAQKPRTDWLARNLTPADRSPAETCHNQLVCGVCTIERAVIVNGQARALIESMPNEIGTEAVGPLSFDEAFTLHHRAVFRTARAVVRDSALAEDVTQEVFLRLYRNLNATPGEELLRAWLLRVTLNVARNTLRGQSRSMVRDNEYHKSYADNGLAVEAPEEDYERRLAIEEARRALDKIKEPMRSCLLLKQQGLSYREIANSLSLKETNVGSLVARGRKEFARVYGKIGGRR